MVSARRQVCIVAAVLLTAVFVGGLMTCHEAAAGRSRSLRVVGTFLDEKADHKGEKTIVFSYKRKLYPFQVKEVLFLNPRGQNTMGTLLQVGRRTIVVFGGDAAVAAIKPEEMVGTTYVLEGQLYTSDGVFQIYHSEVATEERAGP
jgi:hypothetical protein